MAIFGFYGLFVRFLNLASQLILFFNAFFVTVVLFIIFLRAKENFKIKNHNLAIVLLGFSFVANNLCYFKAFKLTTISNAILTHYTAPVFVAILAPIFLRERLEKITLLSLLVSFFGLVLIALEGLSFSRENFLGILFGVFSGIAYAFSILIYKYLLRNLSVYTLIFYQSLIGTIILTPFVFSQISFSLPFHFLLVFALIFGILATFLHFQGIKRVKAQEAGIFKLIYGRRKF
jgi:drug/metabolite transporter (DMT)-like permease